MNILRKDCKYIVHVNDERVTFCETRDALMVHLSTLTFDDIRAATIFSQLNTSDVLDLKTAALKMQGLEG